ncbi:EAL domain-containing protein [Piscinibacter sakaiensis]|uniref:Diguanylate cyclase/phosphodiesterase with PAS/PAC sensor(S) n=1 Tax=Piscinibacter sakaiensis TaxID=1547922 RepID=A0A0K8NTU4_PISS1|nr:EAL domain-containing protein [Piscinibacter sakaiensis]GAP33807.1 diguanylate cyclase/phosphodiesterase with PAS/PAC sensor(s) [Piscinibacter sakaiensis]
MGRAARPTGRPTAARALVFALIGLLAFALTAFAWSQRSKVPLLSNLDGLVLDWQLHRRGPQAPASPVPVRMLMHDERSAMELGSGIPRTTLADTIDRLATEGAAWIAVDILLTEATEPAVDQRLADAIRRAGNVVIPYALPDQSLSRGQAAAPAASAASAASVARAAPIAATGPTGTAAAAGVPEPILDSAFHRYRHEERAALMALKPGMMLAPIGPLLEAARGLGHVSVQQRLDGTLRHDLPAVKFDDEIYPSLAATLTALATGVAPAEMEVSLGESLTIGTRRVPLDLTSQLWVNYLGPRGTIPLYSLADHVAGRLPADRFRGAIVLIGSDALGSGDRYRSPFDVGLPGTERLATVIDNLMARHWLERPAWAATAESAAMLVLPVGVALGLAVAPPAWVLGAAALLGLACFGVSQWLFEQRLQMVSPLFPVLALLLAAGLAMAWRSVLYERERRAAERRLRASEQRFALAARGANDGLWDWDLEAGSTYLSPRARQMMGLPEAVPDGGADAGDPIAAWLEGLAPAQAARLREEIAAHLDGRTQQLHLELQHRRAGEDRWTLVRGVAVREHGRAVRMAGSLTDITEPKRLEQQVVFDAIHDRLTGLANRELFADRLGQWLRPQAAGQPAGPLGLVLLDIDGFRQINEVHGHVSGNQVLVEVAARLRALSDARPGGALVARVGADQFAVAAPGPLDALVALAHDAQAALAAPLAALAPAGEAAHPADAGGLSVTAAVAHTEHGLDGVDELMNGADLAMSQAKRAGHRGRLRSFDPAEQAQQTTRRWLNEHIDRALAAGDQFQLHYQPFVRLSDRALIGFEALIRWKHPERGMVMPGDFIPHAEQTGQINAIGQWTLFEAARQLVAWDAIGFTGEVAVNLSGRQFTETDLEADARRVLELLGPVAPKRYKLEVTESMAMENPQRTAKVLNRLADMGFKISIDDFGTGYSSLAYLHRFPFDTLKIDRSFVIRLGAGREAQEIVRTIVGLGAALDKQVLAEGVEEEAQAQTLQALGVHTGQGWLFAKALPADAATAHIRRG